MAYARMHGMEIIGSETINNLNVERLAADPTPVVAGRIWYNDTDKVMRLSSLDSAGAIVVQTFATEADVLALESVVNVINGDDVTAGSFRKVIADVVGNAPTALATLETLAAAINNDPNIATTLETLVNTSIASLDQQILGTATTAMDTLGEVEAKLTTITTAIGDLATLTTVNKSSLVAAINEVDANNKTNATAISDLSTVVSDGFTAADQALSDGMTYLENEIGTVADLQTSASDLVGAVNELKAEAGAGAAVLKDSLNSRVALYDSATPMVTHSFAHNLSGNYLSVDALFQDAVTGKWLNDYVQVEMDPTAKSATLVLGEPLRARIIVEEKDALA